jgi:hypothetical protein
MSASQIPQAADEMRDELVEERGNALMEATVGRETGKGSTGGPPRRHRPAHGALGSGLAPCRLLRRLAAKKPGPLAGGADFAPCCLSTSRQFEVDVRLVSADAASSIAGFGGARFSTDFSALSGHAFGKGGKPVNVEQSYRPRMSGVGP